MTGEALTPPGAAATGHVASATATILLVEDDPDLRYMARRALERLGYRVLAAGSAEQALDLHRDHGQEIDLVLSDAGLPGLSGADLYQALREREPAVKFLLSSGSGPDKELAHVPFVQKPWTLGVLAEAVASALAG